MLESFQIKNFRLFENLEVQQLNRVNLIVGQNNAGKSTFLEALELYISNAAPSVFLDILESRQESWFSEAQPQTKKITGNSIRHLFFGHKLPKVEEKGISLGDFSVGSQLNLDVAAYQRRTDNEGTTSRVRVASLQLNLFEEEALFDGDSSNVEIFLVAEEGERTRRLFRLDRELRDIRRYSPRSLFEGASDSKFSWQIVSTENMPSRKLAALWDLTSLTSLEKDVVSALRLIDKRVSGIGFVDDLSQRRSHERIPLMKLEGVEEPLPLKSMGDGMTRLFHIIVALVNAQNGLLLIDEFENGLHWTIHSKVWDIIFQLSQELNVQVFATTHSRDCIQGFEKSWNKHPELGAFFRLDNKDGLVRATEYTPETLSDAVEMDVEVR